MHFLTLTKLLCLAAAANALPRVLDFNPDNSSATGTTDAIDVSEPTQTPTLACFTPLTRPGRALDCQGASDDFFQEHDIKMGEIYSVVRSYSPAWGPHQIRVPEWHTKGDCHFELDLLVMEPYVRVRGQFLKHWADLLIRKCITPDPTRSKGGFLTTPSKTDDQHLVWTFGRTTAYQDTATHPGGNTTLDITR